MKTFKPGERIRSSEVNANFSEIQQAATSAHNAARAAQRTATSAESTATENRRVIQQNSENIQSQGRRLNELEARPAPTLTAEVIDNLTLGSGWSDTYSPVGTRLERIGPLRRLILTVRLGSFTTQAAGGVICTLPEGSRPTPSRRSYRLLGMGLIEYSGPSEYVPVPLVVTSLGNVQIAPGHVPARKFIQITAEVIFKPEQ